MRVPTYSIHVTGVSDQRDDDTTEGVQFCVLDPDGSRHVYGDQSWVAYGGAVRDSHPRGRVQRRSVTITYGEWVDHVAE